MAIFKALLIFKTGVFDRLRFKYIHTYSMYLKKQSIFEELAVSVLFISVRNLSQRRLREFVIVVNQEFLGAKASKVRYEFIS